jgi:hypothetical protein
LKRKVDKIQLLDKELNELRDQIKVRDEKIFFLQRGTMGRTIATNNNLVRIIKGGHCILVFT